MNYQKLYDLIIKKHKILNFKKGQDIYLESHHILPKSIGGTNNKENLVNLTAKAHFVAHHLLCKIYPNNNKIIYSFWMFVTKTSNNNKRKYKVTSSMYEKIKKEFSIRLSNQFKGIRKTKKCVDNMKIAAKNRKHKKCIFCDKKIHPHMYARWHGAKCRLNPNIDTQILKERSKEMSTKFKNRKHSEKTKAKISQSSKNKFVSEKTKAKISQSKSGKKQNIVKCPHCDKIGGISNMHRWHFKNCKTLINL